LFWKDELKKHFKGEIPSELVLKSREVESFKVCNYLTNGFEILETNEWPGQSIPFVSGYGKIVFVTQGGQTKRKILSLVRLARDPQMLMAYLATCEAELVGMTPKFPYFYWDGSLTPTALQLLQRSLHEPIAGIPVKLPTTQGAPATFPMRQPYEPPIQALEILKESVRRSIQSAIGSSPMPTQALRHNEKSGIALKQMEDSAQKGSFHFVDHYDEAISRTGEICKENIRHFLDTARTTSYRMKDDKPAMVRINDPRTVDAQGQPLPHVQQNQEAGLDPHIDTSLGDFDVTISVGPRMDSEREATSDFADTLLGSKAMEFVAPPQRAKLLAATVKLKNLGPVGDRDRGDSGPAGSERSRTGDAPVRRREAPDAGDGPSVPAVDDGEAREGARPPEQGKDRRCRDRQRGTHRCRGSGSEDRRGGTRCESRADGSVPRRTCPSRLTGSRCRINGSRAHPRSGHVPDGASARAGSGAAVA
jgi:hypothetical protein